MSIFRLAFAAVLGTVVVLIGAACGDDAVRNDFEDDNVTRPSGPSPQVVIDRDAEPPLTTMRMAHVAPDVGPIDFCYQAARTGSLVGPVLRGGEASTPDAGNDPEAGLLDVASILDAALAPDAASDTDGGSAPLAYRNVSKYRSLASAGPLTIVVVPASATSCANPILSEDVTLDPGKLWTVAVLGRRNDAGDGLGIVAFTDDGATAPETARVRVLHAALGAGKAQAAGPLALRAVATKTTTLAERAEPRRASSPSESVPVDALGYAEVAPIAAPASLAIAPAEKDQGDAGNVEPWQSGAVELEMRGGSLHTAFVLSSANGGFEVVWCADKRTVDDRTDCRVVR